MKERSLRVLKGNRGLRMFYAGCARVQKFMKIEEEKTKGNMSTKN